MARPKTFTDPVAFQVRMERSLLAQIDALAERTGRDRNQTIIAGLLRLLSSPPPKQIGETPADEVSPIANCPHQYRAKPEEGGACLRCGQVR